MYIYANIYIAEGDGSDTDPTLITEMKEKRQKFGKMYQKNQLATKFAMQNDRSADFCKLL